MGEALGCVFLARVRCREVEIDARKLPWAEVLADVFSVGERENAILEAKFASLLRGKRDAYPVVVKADEQHVGIATRLFDDELSLAAT